MRVLVTGGLGFTGQAVTRHLQKQGHQVAVLTSAQRPRVPSPGTHLVRADLRDREDLANVVADGGFEGVCHLGGLTRVRDSFTDPLAYFDVNVGGTLNLLRALDAEAERSGRPTRLVFASTGAVYGAGDGSLNEDEPTVPVNPYAASKLAAEQMIGYQCAQGRLAATSLRCFNIAGAVAGIGDDDLTRIIPKTLAVAAGAATQLEINGDGSAVREYTHVLDVAAAFCLSLDATDAGRHQIYNVGSGLGSSTSEVVETARTISGRPIPAEHRPPKPEAGVLMANSKRIRAELGWRPEHSSLEEIVRDGWAAAQNSTSRPRP